MSQFAQPPSIPQSGIQQPHRATLILVLGILSIVICFICGIVAWVMGNADLKAMDAGTMDPSGRGMTQAGKIIGIVGTILGAIGVLGAIVWIIFVFVVIGGAAAAGAGGHR